MVLGIIGAGGLGREVLDLAKSINVVSNCWESIIFVDDFKNEKKVNDVEVYTTERFIDTFTRGSVKVIIALGEPMHRSRLNEQMALEKYELQTLISPFAFVGSGTIIENGAIIQFGSYISCDVNIGKNVLVQPHAFVAHDTTVGDDSVVSSFVQISGVCTVGKRTYIGIGAQIKEHIAIGSDSIIGMGSVVMNNIPDEVVTLGNPARVIKNNNKKRVFG